MEKGVRKKDSILLICTRIKMSVPAATLGACPGVVCLIRFWFQFERFSSKFLSHPKVLERLSTGEE